MADEIAGGDIDKSITNIYNARSKSECPNCRTVGEFPIYVCKNMGCNNSFCSHCKTPYGDLCQRCSNEQDLIKQENERNAIENAERTQLALTNAHFAEAERQRQVATARETAILEKEKQDETIVVSHMKRSVIRALATILLLLSLFYFLGWSWELCIFSIIIWLIVTGINLSLFITKPNLFE